MQHDPGLKGLMIRHGNGASNFGLSASQHLVRCALRGSFDAGLEWFEKIHSLKSANVLEVLPLWGVEIETNIRLFENVDLVTFKSLPDSSQKTTLLAPDFAQQSYRPPYAWTPPSSALVATWAVSPLYYQGDPDTSLLQAGDSNLLRQIRLCLSTVAPSCIVPTISWFQYEDADLNFSLLGAGYSIPFMEIQPTQIRSFGVFSSEEAISLVSKYLLIGGETKSRINRALDRFDRAMRRHQPEDTAVELAIALESLLSDEGGELTWKIGLRSALLLAGSKEEKIAARKIVRGVYRLRGKVVHTGSAQQEIKVQGLGNMSTQELVAKGVVTTASVLKSVIRRGKLPNWFEEEIGH